MHFFLHCLSGLFDLVMLPHEHLDNPEAIARQDELNQEASYALDLRQDGVPYQPLYVNPFAYGVHHVPTRSDRRRIILMRHPLPTLYSLRRVSRERWGEPPADPRKWVGVHFKEYLRFYDEAFNLRHSEPDRTLLVRYEDLVSDPATLTKVVAFVGRQPKLNPKFVHWVTSFSRFVRQNPEASRSFYRAGRPDSYREDPVWGPLLDSLDPAIWAYFGYGPDPVSSQDSLPLPLAEAA